VAVKNVLRVLFSHHSQKAVNSREWLQCRQDLTGTVDAIELSIAGLNTCSKPHRPSGMTKYCVDYIDRVHHIITGAFAGLLAKQHCTVPRANADVDGDDVTECTGRVQTEPLRTTRGSMCRISTER